MCSSDLFAPDGLTSLGGFPGDDYRGGQMFNKVDGKKMGEDMVASAMWLKSRADCTGKIAATGFCYGGGVEEADVETMLFQQGWDRAATGIFRERVHGFHTELRQRGLDMAVEVRLRTDHQRLPGGGAASAISRHIPSLFRSVGSAKH